MRPEIREIAILIDAAYALFQQALVIGEKLRAALTDEESIQLVQERGAISLRTNSALAEIEQAMAKLQATPADVAFLNEKKARIKDLAPRFKSQDIELHRSMNKRIAVVRTESASLKRNSHAIRQYIGAPGNKPFIK